MATDALTIANRALSLLGVTNAISALDADAAVEDRVANRFYAACRDELLEKFPWRFAVKIARLVLSSGYREYHDFFDTTAPTVSAITQASPGVITATAHGLSAGDYFVIDGMTGMDELEDEVLRAASCADANTITLEWNTTNFTAYSSGGSIYKIQPEPRYQNGWTFELPSDYLRAIRLQERGHNYEIIGGKLVTADTDDPVLVYIAQITDTTQFSKLFDKLLEYYLALRMAIPLQGAKLGAQLRAELKKDYEDVLAEAQLAHAQEGQDEAEEVGEWVSERS